MQNDRRHFLKTSLGGIAGLSALPLVGGLAGCAQTADGPAPAKASAGVKLPQPIGTNGAVVKVTDRVTVIPNVPGNVVVLSAGNGVLLVDSGSAELAATVQKTLGSARVN